MTTSPQYPNNVLRFLWHFARPYKWRLAVVLCCPLIWSIVNASNSYLLKVVIDAVTSYEGSRTDVWKVALVPVLCFVGLQVMLDSAMRLEEWLLYHTMPKIKANIRQAMFHYVQHHSHRYFQNRLSGTLSNKILDMVRGFEMMFMAGATVFFPIIALTMINAVILATIHWWFSLFIVTWFVVYMSVTISAARGCIQVSDAHSQANSTLSGKIVDAFRNISSIRMFSAQRFEESYLGQYQTQEMQRAERLGRELFKVHLFQGIASTILFSCALILFIEAWRRGVVTVGDFTYVMSSTFSLLILAWWMAEQFVVFFKELGVSRQALDLVTEPHEVRDAEDAIELKRVKGHIQFHHVVFRYGKQDALFADTSLDIPAGSRIGVVGVSGSGKSTFVNLIQRYFDLERGSITIDGQDISKVTQESLRRQIAVIPQDVMLFHRTMMDNIRYGRVDATDDEVIAASKLAHCHSFIQELEERYDSMVGEGGVKLSGGQRQRIAIARAILKNAPILILDEATSALDSVTERLIQKSLTKAMQHRTTIVVAHRLSTLQMMDRILVFEKGRIVEQGSHEALLERGGQYAHLWNTQVNGILPD